MGATKRTPILSAGILALTAILSLPTPGRTGEREVAGMITEINLGEGRADVRSAETELWRPAMPLLTLRAGDAVTTTQDAWRSEEHTSELQLRSDLVCRLLLEKKKTRTKALLNIKKIKDQKNKKKKKKKK